MEPNRQLQAAISAARSGRELWARELFLEIVAAEPRNELAWLWLVGLLDRLEDQIEACEKVLEINPANTSAQKHLRQLLAEDQKVRAEKQRQAREKLTEARHRLQAQRTEDGLYLLRGLTRAETVDPEAWRTLAEYAPSLEEQIYALKNLLRLQPDDLHAQKDLETREHYQKNPLEFATLYEEQGKLDLAIVEYERAARQPEAKDQWDALYWKIRRLEALKHDKIVHVPPLISIIRLTFGPVLVYLAFLLVQVGIWPFAHPEPLLWLGLLWCLLGSLLIALASVHSPERLQALLARRFGSGSLPVARSGVLIGRFLVFFAFVILLTSAGLRLAHILHWSLPW